LKAIFTNKMLYFTITLFAGFNIKIHLVFTFQKIWFLFVYICSTSFCELQMPFKWVGKIKKQCLQQVFKANH
jgi:hypothetical protein